jgi:hypothetical protein
MAVLFAVCKGGRDESQNHCACNEWQEG